MRVSTFICTFFGSVFHTLSAFAIDIQILSTIFPKYLETKPITILFSMILHQNKAWIWSCLISITSKSTHFCLIICNIATSKTLFLLSTLVVLSLFHQLILLSFLCKRSPLQGPTLTGVAVLPVAVQVQAKSVLFPSTAERREDSGVIRGHTLTNLLKTALQAGQAHHHLKFFVFPRLTPTWPPVRTKKFEIWRGSTINCWKNWQKVVWLWTKIPR